MGHYISLLRLFWSICKLMWCIAYLFVRWLVFLLLWNCQLYIRNPPMDGPRFWSFTSSDRRGEIQKKDNYFCFLPFTIKSKYFAWFTVFIFALCTQQLVSIVAATFVGCVQELMVGHMIIRLPFCFYKTIEWCLPNFIKSRYDYVAISDMAEKKLKKRSLRLCPKRKRFSGAEVRVGG